MRTLVVLPTYNEAESIVTALTRVLLSPIGADVLVVDDSSPDGTGRIVTEFGLGFPGRVQLLTRPGKVGLGAAYRAGFALALTLDYDMIVQMDADGSHPVIALEAMAARVAAGADLVIGSRYCPGGGASEGWPWYRRLLSRGGNVYARTMLGLPVADLTGGFKMWRTSALGNVDFDRASASGYGFQVQTTLLAVNAGARVDEVPILFVERERGVSKMSKSIIVEAMLAVCRMRRAQRSSEVKFAVPMAPIAELV